MAGQGLRIDAAVVFEEITVAQFVVRMVVPGRSREDGAEVFRNAGQFRMKFLRVCPQTVRILDAYLSPGAHGECGWPASRRFTVNDP